MYFTANLRACPQPEALRAVAGGPERKKSLFLFQNGTLSLLCMMPTNSQKAILTNIETCLNLSYTGFFFLHDHYVKNTLQTSSFRGRWKCNYFQLRKMSIIFFCDWKQDWTPRIQSYSLDLFFYSALKCVFSWNEMSTSIIQLRSAHSISEVLCSSWGHLSKL